MKVKKNNGSTTRAQRGEQQKERILHVARDLFMSKSYDGTSIEDIANAANLNKGMVYYHYKKKVDILYEIAMQHFQDNIDAMKSIVILNIKPSEKLKKMITNHLEYEFSNKGLYFSPQQYKIYLPVDMFRNYVRCRDEYEAIYRRVFEEISGDITYARIACKMTLTLLNSIRFWYDPKGDLSKRKMVSMVYKYVMHGIKPK